MSSRFSPKSFSLILKAWLGLALLASVGKSSVVVREKCLSHKDLSSHACSASNPSVKALDSNSSTIQTPCYCSSAACGNYAVPKLMASCRSGFVHANKCGACVRCAKDLDEPCGGYADYVGSCRHGLVCEIPEPEGKDDQGSSGEGKCVVDSPEQRKKGKVYRSPKATFPIGDLENYCQMSSNKSAAEPETEVKAAAENPKPEAKKGLRTASLKNKTLKKLSSVERGWREIFNDKDLEPVGSEPQEAVFIPGSDELATNSLWPIVRPVSKVSPAESPPGLFRVLRTMPGLANQPLHQGW